MVLSDTVTSDSGIYQCVGENLAGPVSASARFLVNVSADQPEPPTNLKAVAVSPTQILLTWDPPRNIPVEDIKAYSVHHMGLWQGGEESQSVTLNASIKLDNLRKNSNYSFYVRVYARTASDPSEKITCNTADANPLIATNVTLVPSSPTTLKVQWSRSESSRPVSMYKIQYRRHRAKIFDIEVVKGKIYFLYG